MRILVVEDDDSISQFIQQGLSEAGHAVDLDEEGRLGLDYALSVEYDAIVLDIMLPGINGFTFLGYHQHRCGAP